MEPMYLEKSLDNFIDEPGWYFFDEFQLAIGPYPSKEIALEEEKKYVASL